MRILILTSFCVYKSPASNYHDECVGARGNRIFAEFRLIFVMQKAHPVCFLKKHNVCWYCERHMRYAYVIRPERLARMTISGSERKVFNIVNMDIFLTKMHQQLPKTVKCFNTTPIGFVWRRKSYTTRMPWEWVKQGLIFLLGELTL